MHSLHKVQARESATIAFFLAVKQPNHSSGILKKAKTEMEALFYILSKLMETMQHRKLSRKKG